MRTQKLPKKKLCIRRRHHGFTVKDRLEAQLQIDAATMAMIYYLKIRIESEKLSLERLPTPLLKLMRIFLGMVFIFVRRYQDLMTIDSALLWGKKRSGDSKWKSYFLLLSLPTTIIG